MALNYSVLGFKPLMSIGENKEDKIKDLLCRTWRNDVSPYPVNPVYVTETYKCRPDLISLAVYGSDEYGDLICKYNGISPFEINEGMTIYTPPKSWIQKSIETREAAVCERVDDITSIEKKTTTNAKKRASARTSSDIAVGDPPQYVIDKRMGIVIY